MMKIVILNNQLIILEKLPSESDEMFYDRINFILKNYRGDKIEMSLDNLISYSKIYSNVKYKKCIYSKEIMDNLEKLI